MILQCQASSGWVGGKKGFNCYSMSLPKKVRERDRGGGLCGHFYESGAQSCILLNVQETSVKFTRRKKKDNRALFRESTANTSFVPVLISAPASLVSIQSTVELVRKKPTLVL